MHRQLSFELNERKIKENSNAKCYLFEIIADKSQNIICNKLGNTDDIIRGISIDKFYKLVTGESLAFFNLIKLLKPLKKECIQEIDPNILESSNENNVIDSFNEDYVNLYEGVTSLTFSHYDGFTFD